MTETSITSRRCTIKICPHQGTPDFPSLTLTKNRDVDNKHFIFPECRREFLQHFIPRPALHRIVQHDPRYPNACCQSSNSPLCGSGTISETMCDTFKSRKLAFLFPERTPLSSSSLLSFLLLHPSSAEHHPEPGFGDWNRTGIHHSLPQLQFDWRIFILCCHVHRLVCSCGSSCSVCESKSFNKANTCTYILYNCLDIHCHHRNSHGHF